MIRNYDQQELLISSFCLKIPEGHSKNESCRFMHDIKKQKHYLNSIWEHIQFKYD